MRVFGKRLLVASVLSIATFACTEGVDDTLGPTETNLDPTTVSRPTFSVTSICRELSFQLGDFDLAPGTSSPCDAAHGENGYRGVYFLPSLVGNPNVSGELLSGLAVT